MAELKDIVYNDMKAFYDRGEVEKDIREVLRLEQAIERECQSRNADARDIIRGERLQETKMHRTASENEREGEIGGGGGGHSG